MKQGLRVMRQGMRQLGATECGQEGGHLLFLFGARVIPVPQGIHEKSREFHRVVRSIVASVGIDKQQVRRAFGLEAG